MTGVGMALMVVAFALTLAGVAWGSTTCLGVAMVLAIVGAAFLISDTERRPL